MAGDIELPALLSEFFAQLSVPGVRHAVLLSADGLLVERSAQTGQEAGERLAAACAGLYALGMSATSPDEWRPVRQILVDFSEGFLFARSAGKLIRLAVFTDGDSDLAAIIELAERLIVQFQPVLALLPEGSGDSPSAGRTLPPSSRTRSK